MSSVVLVQEQVIEEATGKPKRKIQYKLQALRGIASLAVLWHHVGEEGYLDHNYKLDLGFIPVGNIRPLLFFMLSGYILSLTNTAKLSNWEEVRHFGQKRFYRLYPIYIVVVLFSFLVGYANFSLNQFVSHLLFLQNFTSDVIFENRALWTMSFEVMFYISFILISTLNVKRYYIPIGAMLTGVALLIVKPDFSMLISFCFGMAFWGVGLVFGRLKGKDEDYPTSYFIALALLLFCYQQLEISEFVFKKLPYNILPVSTDSLFYPVKVVHLAFIPLCFLIIQSFNNKKILGQKVLLLLIYLPVVVRVVYLIYNKKMHEDLYVPTFLFLISVAFLLFSFRVELGFVRRALIFIGSISYSTYLVHFPILYLFHSVPIFSGTWYTAVIRLVLYLITVFSVSYFLEKKYQKWVMRLIETKGRIVIQNRESLWHLLHRTAR